MLALNPERFNERFTTAVASLVADVTAKEPNNIEASAHLMVDMLRADPVLLDELLPSILYQWCVEKLGEVMRARNRQRIAAAAWRSATAATRVQARAPIRGGLSAGQRAQANLRRLAAMAKNTVQTNWLSYELKGGLMLKDATRTAISEQLEIHRGHAAAKPLRRILSR